MGLKAQVPWVRLFDPLLSPKPTEGWYLSYLFAANGSRCYLTLSHGAMVRRDGRFYPREAAETAGLLRWARQQLGATDEPQIDLAATPGSAGSNYARTVAVAIEYPRDSVPSAEVLRADVLSMLDRLDLVYAAEATDPAVPGNPPADVVLAVEELEAAANPRHPKKSGQGFRVSKAEQKAIEQRAVDVATAHFEGAGWAVEDVGLTESYDLDCRRGEERLFVEVKGTTSPGASVILTRNEVALHREMHPSNALAVVSRIVLDKTAIPPSASGGLLRVVSPWSIADEDLTALAFTYSGAALIDSD
ncbi:MrcB family domain-containing protein [Microbacterium sp. JZ31]|uniref:MrcB family domain-containing protein n=1 Tax=Microbacterium sp. JZ31 TaxID=1906274 RepID=UPI0019318D52|nr:DUF3578 domain-containing protein [Microbacterium sp. JZ31]